jgi:uncharacterized phiE125 gp8 family phage protein
MLPQLITGPAVEPLSLAEAKVHLKAETTDDDALIGAIITAVREALEQKTGRAIIDQRWERTLDCFPRCGWSFLDAVIELAYPPLVAVETVKYTDTSGVVQTLAPTAYKVKDAEQPATIAPAYGTSWPATRNESMAVRVRFIAGFAAGLASANPGADTLTHNGLRTLVNDQAVRVSNSGGALPGGLAPATDYYVRNVNGATFQLAGTVGGTPVDITSAGTGQHYLGEIPLTLRQWMLLMIGAIYENREAFIIERSQAVQSFPFVDRLLDRYTVPRL